MIKKIQKKIFFRLFIDSLIFLLVLEYHMHSSLEQIE